VPFDGGYAQVIRPTDRPVPPTGRDRPDAGRSADPARPADRNVYVYRDVSEPQPTPSPRRPAADDAAYWYDLMAEDPAPQHEQARGPFEPLLPSGVPPGAADTPGRPSATEREQGSPDAAGGDGTQAPEQARAHKLEQLKDLYLTAEAIGEQNVDKHFDQLLAQQRELISDYFRKSGTAQPGVAGRGDSQAAETDAAHPDPGAVGGRPSPPEGAGVRAEPPHTW
jgi:hypothetical protein